jgi:hypothetical protein
MVLLINLLSYVYVSQCHLLYRREKNNQQTEYLPAPNLLSEAEWKAWSCRSLIVSMEFPVRLKTSSGVHL